MMTRAHQTFVTCALSAVALLAGGLLAAPAQAGDDLPPPQIRKGAARVLPTRTPQRPRLQPRALPTAPRPIAAPAARAPVRPVPGYMTGKPSAPRAQRRKTTYVPPVGAPRRAAPRRAPTAVPPAIARTPTAVPPATARTPRPTHRTTPRGRVPVTTFRIAPAPKPRVTTWNRPLPVAPSRDVLPRPKVAKVSPSYAELDRTRAQSATSRTRPESSASSRRRTLQRRGQAPTVRRRAVRTRSDLSVPMAPGQCPPRPSVRRTLPLLPPPGCTGDG